MANWDDSTKTASGAAPAGGGGRRAYLIVLAGSNAGSMHEVRERMLLGRAQDADLRFTDEGISRNHAMVTLEGDEVVIHDLGSRNGTYVNEKRVERTTLCDGDKIRIGSTTILKFTHHDNLEESFQRQLYESALRDGLTRAFNKKYFFERLGNELAYALRHKLPLAVIMLDIDYFKGINDTYGHLCGDYVLSRLAQAVGDSVRCEDVFARFGGDEFGIICRGIDAKGASAMAERLRARVTALELEHEGRPIRVTASFGLAALPEISAREPKELVEAADAALYQAKRGGRNRVASAPIPETPAG
jgi:two-component system cell cycle response regulator